MENRQESSRKPVKEPGNKKAENLTEKPAKNRQETRLAIHKERKWTADGKCKAGGRAVPADGKGLWPPGSICLVRLAG